MGSLIVKIDRNTANNLSEGKYYLDVDMFKYDTTDGDLPMVYDVDAVKQSVRNIFMWRVGESILRPAFGHRLNQSMYSQLTSFNKDTVVQEIQRAIEENEPRAVIKSISAKMDDEDDESNRLKIKVVYTVIGNKTESSDIVEERTITRK